MGHQRLNQSRYDALRSCPHFGTNLGRRCRDGFNRDGADMMSCSRSPLWMFHYFVGTKCSLETLTVLTRTNSWVNMRPFNSVPVHYSVGNKHPPGNNDHIKSKKRKQWPYKEHEGQNGADGVWSTEGCFGRDLTGSPLWTLWKPNDHIRDWYNWMPI